MKPDSNHLNNNNDNEVFHGSIALCIIFIMLVITCVIFTWIM